MKRYIVLSVPDNDTAYWFVYDRKARRSVECESRQVAAEVCKLANQFKARSL